MGITDTLVNIDDLSDSQIQYLKPLLWVEVMGIFDQYKTNIVKRKANTKVKSKFLDLI